VKILHVIKTLDDRYAYEMASRQREEEGHSVGILLLQDAVLTPPVDASGLFACREDVEARGGPCPGRAVGYEEIVRMLLEYDTVICW